MSAAEGTQKPRSLSSQHRDGTNKTGMNTCQVKSWFWAILNPRRGWRHSQHGPVPQPRSGAVLTFRRTIPALLDSQGKLLACPRKAAFFTKSLISNSLHIMPRSTLHTTHTAPHSTDRHHQTAHICNCSQKQKQNSCTLIKIHCHVSRTQSSVQAEKLSSSMW